MCGPKKRSELQRCSPKVEQYYWGRKGGRLLVATATSREFEEHAVI
jgi:hypothetical protein